MVKRKEIKSLKYSFRTDSFSSTADHRTDKFKIINKMSNAMISTTGLSTVINKIFET